MNRIILNETSYFGEGSRSTLANEIKNRGFKKVFVVSDNSLVKAGITGMILDVLESGKISYEVFTDLKANPTVTNVKNGVEAYKKSGCDVIVAVGGGSVIDTSKAIGIIINNPEHGNVITLEGAVNTRNRSVPIIALPTTAGTAAEVTINYVITDENSVTKMVCVDPHDIPIVAIIDPELMEKMPKSLAAATGMDALTHAIEGYITKANWVMTDMFHIQAIKMIHDNLRKAVLDKDKEAINNMGIAQYIAGMGFSNVGLGIVHSMAHQLGAVYDTPHGVANAVLLPFVLKFNAEVCPEKIRDIAIAFGLSVDGLSDEIVKLMVFDDLISLASDLEIPLNLEELGVKEEDIPMLSEKAMRDACTPGNPRDVTKEQIEEIYREAYSV